MKIFLVGLAGSGKTTLGKQLANDTGLSFIDLDTSIEAKERKPIREIFALKGEEYFRSAEARCLRQIASNQDNFILATGGGAPLFHDNMKFMNNCGITVFLDVPHAELVNRINQSDLEERPLFAGLTNTQLMEKILSMRELRLPFYKSAKIILQGAAITTNDILSALNKNSEGEP